MLLLQCQLLKWQEMCQLISFKGKPKQWCQLCNYLLVWHSTNVSTNKRYPGYNKWWWKAQTNLLAYKKNEAYFSWCELSTTIYYKMTVDSTDQPTYFSCTMLILVDVSFSSTFIHNNTGFFYKNVPFFLKSTLIVSPLGPLIPTPDNFPPGSHLILFTHFHLIVLLRVLSKFQLSQLHFMHTSGMSPERTRRVKQSIPFCALEAEPPVSNNVSVHMTIQDVNGIGLKITYITCVVDALDTSFLMHLNALLLTYVVEQFSHW